MIVINSQTMVAITLWALADRASLVLFEQHAIVIAKRQAVASQKSLSIGSPFLFGVLRHRLLSRRLSALHHLGTDMWLGLRHKPVCQFPHDELRPLLGDCRRSPAYDANRQ